MLRGRKTLQRCRMQLTATCEGSGGGDFSAVGLGDRLEMIKSRLSSCLLSDKYSLIWLKSSELLWGYLNVNERIICPLRTLVCCFAFVSFDDILYS